MLPNNNNHHCNNIILQVYVSTINLILVNKCSQLVCFQSMKTILNFFNIDNARQRGEPLSMYTFDYSVKTDKGLINNLINDSENIYNSQGCFIIKHHKIHKLL